MCVIWIRPKKISLPTLVPALDKHNYSYDMKFLITDQASSAVEARTGEAASLVAAVSPLEAIQARAKIVCGAVS